MVEENLKWRCVFSLPIYTKPHACITNIYTNWERNTYSNKGNLIFSPTCLSQPPMLFLFRGDTCNVSLPVFLSLLFLNVHAMFHRSYSKETVGEHVAHTSLFSSSLILLSLHDRKHDEMLEHMGLAVCGEVSEGRWMWISSEDRVLCDLFGWLGGLCLCLTILFLVLARACSALKRLQRIILHQFLENNFPFYEHMRMACNQLSIGFLAQAYKLRIAISRSKPLVEKV